MKYSGHKALSVDEALSFYKKIIGKPSLFIILLLLCSCSSKKTTQEVTTDFPEIKKRGEITAVTLNSSTSYFEYRMQPMGYEYDLIAEFAEYNNLKLNIKIAENITRLMEMLQNNEADIVAYPIQMDNKMKQEVLFCGHEQQSELVIVQRANRKDTILKDVTQLIGKEVYVKPNTRFHARLESLNKELGGGIKIVDIAKDTITSEDLIEMVSKGEIPYTVCDNKVAKLNQTYFRNINISLPISFMQRSSWIVRKDCPLLAEEVNKWASTTSGVSSYKSISKRYFELSKGQPVDTVVYAIKGEISLYDHLFKKYAPKVGWDWRLIASIAYQESHFKPNASAWSGAQGLMGIMPRTAVSFGFNVEDMKNPDKSIQAGIACLKRFGKGFEQIPDSLERIKLTLASYNAGVGHVYDAQNLARKYGKDPTVWTNNVDEFIRLKSDPEFYTDSVCKYGYLRGRETYNYVIEVIERFEKYKSMTSH